jgi:hypothetical protein
MADTRTFAVLKFLKSGTTLASIKVRLAKAAVDSRKVSAEVVLADKPEKLKRSKLVIICSMQTQWGLNVFEILLISKHSIS